MGLERDAATRTTHWEMLREVFGGVERLFDPRKKRVSEDDCN